MSQSSSLSLVLPASIATKRDVARLVREAETVDAALTEQAIRARAQHQNDGMMPPILSAQFDDFVRTNSLSLADAKQREMVITALRKMKDSLPVVHMTFASEVDSDSLVRLVEWVRQEVDQTAVVEVGLQPSLVAGVYVRTNNKIFDLSARKRIADSHDVLIRELEALHG